MKKQFTQKEVLESLYVGREDAWKEEGEGKFSDFFVDHKVLQAVLRDEFDLILGMKGAGKSNLFLFLTRYASQARKRRQRLPDDVTTVEINVADYADQWGVIEQTGGLGEIAKIRTIWWSILAKATLRTVHQERWIIRDDFDTDGLISQALVAYRIIPAVSSETKTKFDVKIASTETTKRGGSHQFGSEPNPLEVLKRLNDIAKSWARRVWILMDNIEDVGSDQVNEKTYKIVGVLLHNVFINCNFDYVALKIFSRWDIFRILQSSNKDKIPTRFVIIRWDDQQQAIRLLLKRLVTNSRVNVLLRQASGINYLAKIDGLSNTELRGLFQLIFGEDSFGSPPQELYEYIGNFFPDGNRALLPRWLILWCYQLKKVGLEGALDSTAQLPLFSRSAIEQAFVDVSDLAADYAFSYPSLDKHVQILAESGKFEFTRSELEGYFGAMELPDMPIGISSVEQLCNIGFLSYSGRRPKRSKTFGIPVLFQKGLEGMRTQ